MTYYDQKSRGSAGYHPQGGTRCEGQLALISSAARAIVTAAVRIDWQRRRAPALHDGEQPWPHDPLARGVEEWPP